MCGAAHQLRLLKLGSKRFYLITNYFVILCMSLNKFILSTFIKFAFIDIVFLKLLYIVRALRF